MRDVLDIGLLPGLSGFDSVAPQPDDSEWSQIAPGQYIASDDPDALPDFVVAKIIPGEGAALTLELDEEAPLGYFRIKKSMKFNQSLRMEGLSYATLRRLCFAGFVDYVELAPGTTFISVDSLKAHIECTRNTRGHGGEGFWNPERLERWREVIDLGADR